MNVATTIAAPFSPLVVMFRSEDGTRYWKLDIQQKPEPRIVFTGDAPTLEEIVAALSVTVLPVVMVPIIQAVIGHALALQAASAAAKAPQPSAAP